MPPHTISNTFTLTHFIAHFPHRFELCTLIQSKLMCALKLMRTKTKIPMYHNAGQSEKETKSLQRKKQQISFSIGACSAKFACPSKNTSNPASWGFYDMPQLSTVNPTERKHKHTHDVIVYT